MVNRGIGIMLTTLLGVLPCDARGVDWLADVETGVVWANRNDVRIPGTTGTTFSLVNDLQGSAAPVVRVRAGATFGGRHTVLATWAPVRLEFRGVLPKQVAFAGTTFAQGSSATAGYRFDSYRLTYRYRLVRAETLDLDLGATAFVRDAAISMQGAAFAEKTNVGFVPLLSFRLEWRFASPVSLLVEGDALAAPQGRAEDVLVAVQLHVGPGVALRAGYRIIEGGAGNDEVYNFALLSQVVAGIAGTF